MTQPALQQAALTVSTATTELITRILSHYPQAQIRSRAVPLTDEDISLEVVLPGSMSEIYAAREWVYNVVIELQERYDLTILVSVIPPEGEGHL
jgi:hypothetical protein